MLPFDRKPWASQLAKAVILFTILAEIATILWLRRSGPLDTPEIVALVLVLIGVIPANIHIIRARPDEQLDNYTDPPRTAYSRRTTRST